MIDLITPIYAEAEKRRKLFPQHANRASSLGGPCERELVYARTHWDKATIPDVDTQLILEEGEKHEKAVLRLLEDAGFQVCEQQISLEWPEYQITGHQDATVVVEKINPPLDVKSMNPHIFDGIFKRGRGVYEWSEVAEGFQQKPWLRKYRGQITLYCLLRNVDLGILLCKNKSTGALAQVNIPLDYQYGEELLQRATRINAHVAAGTLPDRISFTEGICPMCRFYAVCLPDHVGKDPLCFLEDEEVVLILAGRDMFEVYAKEYERLDDRFKAWAKARPEMKISIGDWLVEKEIKGGKTFSKARKCVVVDKATDKPVEEQVAR